MQVKVYESDDVQRFEGVCFWPTKDCNKKMLLRIKILKTPENQGLYKDSPDDTDIKFLRGGHLNGQGLHCE